MTYHQHKAAVWEKAKRVPGKNPAHTRKDAYGNLIRWQHYGMSTKYGWHIDHHIPQSRGGSDDVSNLVPMQYAANIKKSNGIDATNRKDWIQALEKKTHAFKDCQKVAKRVQVGQVLLVKQSPVTEAKQATVVRFTNTGIVVKWTMGSYEQEIDSHPRLFLEIGRRRPRK